MRAKVREGSLGGRSETTMGRICVLRVLQSVQRFDTDPREVRQMTGVPGRSVSRTRNPATTQDVAKYNCVRDAFVYLTNETEYCSDKPASQRCRSHEHKSGSRSALQAIWCSIRQPVVMLRLTT